ncbi:MAG: hypothetical protein AABX47_05110 [Nanoarchaeota archaeon]
MPKKILFKNNSEKTDLAKLGLLIDLFGCIEYQIDELIALFLGRENHSDAFVEIICGNLTFNSKLKILKKILSIDEVKKINTLDSSDIQFIKDFQNIRNTIAHSSYLRADGDIPSSMFSSRSRSFNLSDSGRIERIQNRSVEIEKKIFAIQKNWWKQPRRLPIIKLSTTDDWVEFSAKSHLNKDLNPTQ